MYRRIRKTTNHFANEVPKRLLAKPITMLLHRPSAHPFAHQRSFNHWDTGKNAAKLCIENITELTNTPFAN